MPLSKKRDRERKRQARLESKNIQPNEVMALYTRDEKLQAYNGALGPPEFDADGQPIYGY